MQARLRVMPEKQFEQWLAQREQRRLAGQAAPGGGA
jgi:heme/copper-type cytochrome/quinol oxidase subunit 2